MNTVATKTKQGSTHEKFLRNLEKSHAVVEYVANWFRDLGYSVQVGERRRALSHDQWRDNVDAGDLFVDGHRIEVKGLTREFSEDSWPFGEKFIVCQKHSYDLATQKPERYLILSKSMLWCAIVDVPKTAEQWYVEKKFDTRYNLEREYYLCPLHLVRFMRLTTI